MLTQAQAKARKIGGSSAGTILGINKYRTRHQEYLRMTGQEEPEDLSENVNIIVGNLVEPIIARMVKERGFNIDTDCEQEIHPKYPYISRNLDAKEGDSIVHEFKSAINFMRKQFENGPIPTYEAQLQHYDMWPGVKTSFLHTLFIPMELKVIMAEVKFTEDQLFEMCSTLELLTQEVEPDFMLQEYMLEQYTEFMKYVESHTPPPAQNMKELQQMFMMSTPGSIPASDEDLRADTRLREIKKEIKTLEDEYTDNKFKICEKLGDAERLISGDTTIRTWKTNKRGVRVFR